MGVISDGGRRVMGLMCCRSSSLRLDSPALVLYCCFLFHILCAETERRSERCGVRLRWWAKRRGFLMKLDWFDTS